MKNFSGRIVIIVLMMVHGSWLSADLTSRLQNGTDNAYQYGLVSDTAGGFNAAITGPFVFSAGLTLDPDHSAALRVPGVVNGTFTLPYGFYVHLLESLHLGPNVTIATPDGVSVAFLGYGNTMFLDGDGIFLNSPLRLRADGGGGSGVLTVDGQGHSLTLGAGINFQNDIQAGVSLTMTNMSIVNQSAAMFYSFTASDGSLGTLSLNNVIIRPTGTSGVLIDASGVAARGGAAISGNVRIEGFGTRLAIGGDLVIGSNSMLYVGPGVTLTEIPSITMTDSTSVLCLDGCTLYTDSAEVNGWAPATQGLTLTKGTVIFKDKVTIINTVYGGVINADMSKGLIFGDGTANNDVDVRVLSGAYVVVNGCMKYNHS